MYTPAGFANGTVEKALTREDLQRDPTAALAEVNTLWFKWDCEDSRAILSIISQQFTKVMVTGEHELWVRMPRPEEWLPPRKKTRPRKKK